MHESWHHENGWLQISMIYVHLFLYQHGFAAMHFENLDIMGPK